MTKAKRTKKAEWLTLPVGIPGVGRAGDRIISDPDSPNGRRLIAVRYLDEDLLPAIKERVAESEDAAKKKEASS